MFDHPKNKGKVLLTGFLSVSGLTGYEGADWLYMIRCSQLRLQAQAHLPRSKCSRRTCF